MTNSLWGQDFLYLGELVSVFISLWFSPSPDTSSRLCRVLGMARVRGDLLPSAQAPCQDAGTHSLSSVSSLHSIPAVNSPLPP